MMSSSRRTRVVAFVAVLAFAVAIPAAAQAPARRVSFGGIVGISQARMTLPLDTISYLNELSLTITNEPRAGWVAGVFIDAVARGRTSFETGVLASLKGANLDIDVPGVGIQRGAMRLLYLDFPVLARVETARWNGGHVYFLTGPTIDFNMNAVVSANLASAPLDGFPAMDYAWTVAGRVQVRRTLLELRYDHGLRNLTAIDGMLSHNRALHAIIGWRF
jgi:hypothetical protein